MGKDTWHRSRPVRLIRGGNIIQTREWVGLEEREEMGLGRREEITDLGLFR